MMATLHFASRETFYEARGGERSGECDYGVWWTGARPWPRFSLHIVHETGDVYIRDLQHGSLEVVATLPSAQRLDCPLRRQDDSDPCPYRLGDRVLDGWTDHIHDEGSLGWVRWAFQGYPVREASADARPV